MQLDSINFSIFMQYDRLKTGLTDAAIHTTEELVRIVPTVIFTITDPLQYHTPAIVALMIHHLTAILLAYNINNTTSSHNYNNR